MQIVEITRILISHYCILFYEMFVKVSHLPPRTGECLTCHHKMKSLQGTTQKEFALSETKYMDTSLKLRYQRQSFKNTGQPYLISVLLNKDYSKRLQDAKECTIDADTEEKYIELINRLAEGEKTTRDIIESRLAGKIILSIHYRKSHYFYKMLPI